MNRKAGRTLARKIGAAMMAGLFMADSAVFAAAPIMPDAGAPASRHPLVQETANGIPLVHIAAPSASGVSRNDYDRFNVPEKGAILNNSYTLSKTELAGYVQGNPNMAKGPARIIVNQVTGSSATAMNGFLEVAGNKADVVIANPNGITVNGGGFINTGRAILATGKPEFDAGENLEDLRVNGNGTILIDGKGLDGRKADSLAIYTRAARVNAAIWANTLHVTTGANTVEAETGKAVPITPEGKKPEVALDVSAVGGMYAGRIFLVGTEKGLGFRMDGHMNTDDLILDADGHLYHSGTIHAAREADLEVSSLEHQGTLVSEGKLKIQSDGNLVNTGTLGAGKELAVHADAITNDQAVIASEGSLSMETTRKGMTSLSNREGKILSNGTTQVRTNSLDNTKGTLSSGGRSCPGRKYPYERRRKNHRLWKQPNHGERKAQ